MALQLQNLFKKDDELDASGSGDDRAGGDGGLASASGSAGEKDAGSGATSDRPSPADSGDDKKLARKKSVHVAFSDRVVSGDAASVRSGKQRRRAGGSKVGKKASKGQSTTSRSGDDDASSGDAQSDSDTNGETSDDDDGDDESSVGENDAPAKSKTAGGGVAKRRGAGRKNRKPPPAAITVTPSTSEHKKRKSGKEARRRGSSNDKDSDDDEEESDAGSSSSDSQASVGADGLTASERRNVELNQMTLRTALRQVAAGESLRLYAKGEKRPLVSEYLQSVVNLTPPDPEKQKRDAVAKQKQADREQGSAKFPGAPRVVASAQSTSAALEDGTMMKVLSSSGGGGEGGGGGTVVADDQPASSPQLLGTVLGVYLPCVQNILGVILFLRMDFIVGNCGVFGAACLIAACCLTTSLTALSMSAIATNGRVPGGGSYYMISRALGPEFGGAVGVLFFLGTSVAAAMYVLGAVEVLFVLFPVLDFHPIAAPRAIGVGLLLLITLLIRVGVRVASLFGSAALAVVVLCIVCIFVGFFTASMPERGLPAEIPGLAESQLVANAWPQWVEGNSLATMLALFFPSVTGIMAGSNRSDILREPSRSIPWGTLGAILTTTIIYEATAVLLGATVTRDGLLNTVSSGVVNGTASLSQGFTTTPPPSASAADVMTTMVSGVLNSATAAVTSSFMATTGAAATNGTAVATQGRLLVAQISWPIAEIVSVGVLLSSLGAGIQSTMGAPRLLFAISNDGVLPFLSWFGKRSASGEPSRALYLTAALCFLGIMAGNLNAITPIITMFFLMCYGFVNLACFIHSILRLPNWRPRWRFYSPITAFLGLVACFVFMFLISWAAALGAIVLSAALWVYIHYKGVQANWGDGLTGLKFQLARQALLALPAGELHTKNWRPQILTLVSVNDDLSPAHLQMFALLHQLKKAHGFSLCVTVLRGRLADRVDDMRRAEDTLRQTMAAAHVKGFARALVSERPWEAIHATILAAGLGGMVPNTVLLGWPGERKQGGGGLRRNAGHVFRVVRDASAAGLTVLIARGLDLYPMNTAKLTGTIDVWWVLHDGGLLLLLPHLLLRHPVWRRCKLRVFTLAQLTDNSVKMEADLKKLLYELRIDASVEVVEMVDEEISPYAHERTVYMKQRQQALSSMGYTDSELGKLPQFVTDVGHVSRGAATGGRDDTGDDDESDLLNMNAAVKLNTEIRARSSEAQLVLLNLPPDRPDDSADEYWEYVNVVTEKVPRILLVKGTGTEVVTVYS